MGTRSVLSAAALSAALAAALTVVLAGCGAADHPAAATAAPADPAAAAAAVPGLPMGSEVTVSAYPGAIGSIRVSDAASWTRSARPLSDPPRAGAYVQVKVSARSVGTELFDLYPFDFYLADAQGHRYEYGTGNGFAEYGRDQLDSNRLGPGEQVSGALLFDASPRADRLVYAPLGRPVQSWRLER